MGDGKFSLSYDGKNPTHTFTTDTFTPTTEKIGGSKLGFDSKNIALCFVVGHFNGAAQAQRSYNYGTIDTRYYTLLTKC